MKAHRIFWKTVGLGCIAGARAMAAPALLINHFHHHPSSRLGHSKLGFMQHSAPALAGKFLMGGEFLGDKLPAAPNRIKPNLIVGRALSGLLVGATVYTSAGKRTATGALVGAAAAVASTYLTFFLRKQCGEACSVPDKLLGLAEDALVLRAGSRLTGNL